MQKILLVITKANWGGAQRYVFDLATSLSKEQFAVSVAFGQPGRLADKLQSAGIPTHHILSLQRDVSVGADLHSFFELYALFKKERPHVVHLNSSKAGGVGALAARLAGIPNIVFTSHGLAWDEDRNTISKLFIYVASRLTFLLCHHVITISRDNYERVRAISICKSKIKLVHNGIGPLEFLPKQEARAQLGAPQEGLVIGAVGELTWNKGYHHLLRAAKELKHRGKHFNLVIVGEGEERGFLETLIKEEDLAGEVRLVGFVADAYRTLKAFDIFVLPSLKEGLPYVLLEAGAAQLPVVATRVGGIPDLVEHRVSGLLCAAKNHTELADRLAELIDDTTLRQKVALGLHERTTKEFSIATMVQQTGAVYKN